MDPKSKHGLSGLTGSWGPGRQRRLEVVTSDAVLRDSGHGPPQICGVLLSRQTEEYFLPRMIQDLTEQVSPEGKALLLWGRTLWARVTETTLASVGKEQGGDISVPSGEGVPGTPTRVGA